MPSLGDLQAAMRRSLVERDDIEIVPHVVGAGIAPQERLAVYRNTFEQTLIKALRLSFPAIDRLVGAAFFDAAARELIAQSPPCSGYLDEFGGGLPAFLERFAPAASVPYLADVARHEWAINCALHAPDAPCVTAAMIESVDAQDYAHLCFVAHPSVSVVHTVFPADVIWRAVLDEDEQALGAIDLSAGPVWEIVWRGASGVEMLRIDEMSWQFAGAVCAGRSLGRALNEHPCTDAATTLAMLLARGCLACASQALPIAASQFSGDHHEQTNRS